MPEFYEYIYLGYQHKIEVKKNKLKFAKTGRFKKINELITVSKPNYIKFDKIYCQFMLVSPIFILFTSLWKYAKLSIPYSRI